MSILIPVLLATIAGALVGLIVGAASGVKRGLMSFYISLLTIAALIAFVIHMQTQKRFWMLISAVSVYGIIQIVRAAKRPSLAIPPPRTVGSVAELTSGSANPPETLRSPEHFAAPEGRPALPVIPTRGRSAFGTGSKIFIGLFATPIVFIVSTQMFRTSVFRQSSDAPVVVTLAFCLVGLLWVGVTAWIRNGRRRRG